jgi:hypothetical protein
MNSKQLETIATRLLEGKRKTRRGKRKKKVKNAKWQKEFDEAMKRQQELKKANRDYFLHLQNFERAIGSD